MSGVILGAGGHARVVQDILGWEFSLIQHPIPKTGGLAFGFVDTKQRRKILKEEGVGRFVPAVHGASTISQFAEIGHAPQIMAGAIVQAAAVLGDFVVINTGAQVDHDCVIGDYVVIAPGAVLLGGVLVEDDAFVGGNATILGQRKIGRGAIVGAGAVVTKDVEPWSIVAGVPARVMRYREDLY